MIWAWIETSSALTASSQMTKLGLYDHGARDADALVLSAGKFMRIAVDPAGIEAHRAIISRTSRRAPRRAKGPAPALRSGSAMDWPIVMRGSRLASGSWNTIWNSLRSRRGFGCR